MFSGGRQPFPETCLTGALAASLVVFSGCSKSPEGRAVDSRPEVEPSGLVDSSGLGWDPVAELAALEGAPTEGRGAQVLRIYRRWAESDGEAALLHAEAHGQGIAAASLREAFAGWLAKDAPAAQAWVRGVPEGRRLLVLATALGEALPTARSRAEWALSLGDSDAGSKVLSRALAQWGRSAAPGEALAWLGEQGGVDRRAREVGDLVRAWADLDPAAAGSAIDALPAGAGRDAAVTALVTVIAPEQGETAKTWAETVGDEQRRAELLALVAKIGGAGAPALQP